MLKSGKRITPPEVDGVIRGLSHVVDEKGLHRYTPLPYLS